MDFLAKLILGIIEMLIGPGKKHEIEGEISKPDPHSEDRSDALDDFMNKDKK